MFKYLKDNNYLYKIAALCSGLSWSLNGLMVFLFLFVFKHPSFINNPFFNIRLAISIIFASDIFSFFIIVILIFALKKQRELLAFIKNKRIWISILSSTLGAPMGMTFYVLGIVAIGAGMSSAITVAYPVIGSMLAFIFLKEKFTKNGIFGTIISLASILSLGILQIQNGDFKNAWGILFAVLAAACWALESFLSGFLTKQKTDYLILIFFRYLVSIIITSIIILPSFKAYGHFKMIFESPKILLVICAGIFGFVSYILFYKSIDKIGVQISTSLNISFVPWTIILELSISSFYPFYFYILAFVIFTSQIITMLPDDKFIFKKWTKKTTNS